MTLPSVAAGRWLAVATALAVHASMRFAGLFGPADWRPLILASFLFLWITPFLLLTRDDRRAIGLGKFMGAGWLADAFFVGAATALAIFASAWALYGLTPDHPFLSVRDSYFSGVTPPLPPFGLFLAFTIPAMIFSPVGEEFFCRGVIARLGERQFSAAIGVALSAGVFALLHVMHHGLVRVEGGWSFIGWSGALWFAQTFAISVLFSLLRLRSGSIWMAVVAHSGFNLAMNALIFSLMV